MIFFLLFLVFFLYLILFSLYWEEFYLPLAKLFFPFSFKLKSAKKKNQKLLQFHSIAAYARRGVEEKESSIQTFNTSNTVCFSEVEGIPLFCFVFFSFKRFRSGTEER